MSVISIAVVCDGTSDLCIQDLIQWITDTSFPDQAFRITEAREVIPAHGSLKARLKQTYFSYEPHIIVCHRDAENQAAATRVGEITDAHTQSNIPIPVVPAVPVRMIESWLLTSVYAIRCAASNKNGTVDLNLPRNKNIEQLTDPKEALFNALKAASDLPARRLKNFDEHRARRRVASFIDDFDSLKQLPSFRTFEDELVKAILAIRSITAPF